MSPITSPNHIFKKKQVFLLGVIKSPFEEPLLNLSRNKIQKDPLSPPLKGDLGGC